MRMLNLMGTVSLLSMVAMAAEDEAGAAPIGIIELEDNLSDIEKPKELPQGTYTGEIQDVQMQKSQKGNDYFAVKFVVPPEELPADFKDQYEDGVILYWNRQVVPKKGDARAAFNLRKFIEALGMDTNTSVVDPNEWMGQRAKLRIRHRTWEGETRAEIQSVESAEKKPANTKGAGGAGTSRGSKRR